jgi:hypothetical protein
VQTTQLEEQLKELSFEISRMNLMTQRPGIYNYDKNGIILETEMIDRLGKSLDTETVQIEKRLNQSK